MKKLLILFAFTGLLACKKEKPAPTPEPEPAKKGTLVFKVLTYDSLGEPSPDKNNIKLVLDGGNSAFTDANGEVVFENLVYGNYFPALLREGWDGPPTVVSLNAPTVTVQLPFPKRSGFKLQNFGATPVNKDSIMASFSLDKSIPPGKTVKIALIASTNADLDASHYESVDVFTTSVSGLQEINIAKFSNFKAWAGNLENGKTIYINAMPVSYGDYQSGIISTHVLLGENLFPPTNIIFKKNW